MGAGLFSISMSPNKASERHATITQGSESGSFAWHGACNATACELGVQAGCWFVEIIEEVFHDKLHAVAWVEAGLHGVALLAEAGASTGSFPVNQTLDCSSRLPNTKFIGAALNAI